MGIYDPLSKAAQEEQDKADRELEELEARRKAHYESEAEKDRLIPMRLAVKQFRIVEAIRNYKEPERFDIVSEEGIRTVTREEFDRIRAKERGLRKTHDENEIRVDDDEAEDITSYEKYIEVCQSGEWHAHNYDDLQYVPPGFGTSSKICGKWVPSGCIGAAKAADELATKSNKAQDTLHAIKGHGVANKKLLSCGMLSCIKCLKPTVKRRASAATDRMLSYLIFMLSDVYKEHHKRIWNHIVISPKSDLHQMLKDPKELKKYEARIARRMKKIGIEGGAIVFHGFRFTKGLKRPYWSPHWHYVCTGFTTPEDIEESYRKLNAVVRSINTFTNPSRLFVLFRYLLTHAVQNKDPSKPNYHTVRYLGLANNRHFKNHRIMAQSSECKDDLSKIIHDITSGEIVRNQKRKEHVLRCASVRMQIVKYNVVDVADSTVYPEQVFTKYTEIKEYIEDNVEHYDILKDNVPNAICDDSDGPAYSYFAVMQARFTEGINEKCHEFTEFFALDLTQSHIGLCHICRRKKRRLVLDDLSRVERLDIFDHLDKASDDVSIPLNEYHYFSRMDLLGGLPYYDDEKDTIQYDDGILERNIFFQMLSKDHKSMQCEDIKQSVIKKLKQDCRNELEWPSPDEQADYAAARLVEYTQLFTQHEDKKILDFITE